MNGKRNRLNGAGNFGKALYLCETEKRLMSCSYSYLKSRFTLLSTILYTSSNSVINKFSIKIAEKNKNAANVIAANHPTSPT